jgi:hypothetical protein
MQQPVFYTVEDIHSRKPSACFEFRASDCELDTG